MLFTGNRAEGKADLVGRPLKCEALNRIGKMPASHGQLPIVTQAKRA
jgi:hypothetical protein